MKKKILCLVLAISSIAFFMVNCATDPGRLSFSPGTFIGTGEGLMGDVKVEVVFSRRAISNVTVIEHRETPLHADAPIARIPSQIVQYQTLNVDRVAGSTVTSFAIVAAVEDAVRQANGDPSQLWATRAPSPRSNEVVNLNVDMVVVGAGASGKIAAITAAERGAGNVLLLEKMPGIGGSGIFMGLAAVPNPTINASYRPLAEQGHSDTVNRILYDPAFGPAQGAANRALFEYWRNVARQDFAAHQAATPDRVFDSLAFFIIMGGNPTTASVTTAVQAANFLRFINENGMQWAPAAVGVALGAPPGTPAWPRMTRPDVRRYTVVENFFKLFTDHVARNNLPLELKLETRATELVEGGDGSVVGVRARHISGRQYNITAERVVLATGGFSANFDMIMEHAGHNWPELNRSNFRTTNHLGSMGDGIVMGSRVGARTEMLGEIVLLPIGDAQTGILQSLIGLSSSGPFVNLDGHRFTDEVMFGHPQEPLPVARNRIARAIFAQPDGMHWVISDRNNSTLIDGLNTYIKAVDHLIARGHTFKAENLGDLARQINIAPDVLERTIGDFNAAVDRRSDLAPFPLDTHARTLFPANASVLAPPFYASPRRPAVHTTTGGLVRGDDFRIIRDSTGQSIPGLYAIGEVVVGRFGFQFNDGKDIMLTLFP